MAKTVTNYSQWFTGATTQAAQDAFAAFKASGCYPHYLYFKPHGLAFAVVMDETKTPDGFELVTNERIPADRTLEGLTAWIRKHTASVPVLPGD